jgi:hypothetical protein
MDLQIHDDGVENLNEMDDYAALPTAYSGFLPRIFR